LEGIRRMGAAEEGGEEEGILRARGILIAYIWL
jgi:hypothetical protein